MKVAILAGGNGTRLAEETVLRPKPMVEIGGHPILWHIMQHYRHYGFSDFVIALGYKGECIRDFFVQQCAVAGNLRVDFRSQWISPAVTPQPYESAAPSVVDLIDTGESTQTGGRIKRLAPWLDNETFMLTWGDGVSDINLEALLRFHRSHGKLATVTAVRRPERFGCIEISEGVVTSFQEKQNKPNDWINGAFFVLEPGVLDYIEGDSTQFELEPLQRLTAEGQLMAFQHESFWQCMDTAKERQLLQSLWDSGNPPWKCWTYALRGQE